MLIFRLLNLIKGYAVINLNVTDYEKILNLLRKNNIKAWDIEKGEKGITFKISYSDYKTYSSLIDESDSKLIKKSGAAFKYKKLKMRKGFLAGVIILVLCFFVFASFIWNVEIIGADYNLSKQIINVLNENKIRIPSAEVSIDCKKIENTLYKNFSNLKFVEAYIEGSKLIIFVREKEDEKSVLKENSPSSIIASKDAVINKIIAKNGQPVVKVGDVVYKGQTLVMGIVKNKNSDEFMMVPSEGTIYGKTYYSFELKEKKLKSIKTSTNNVRKIYYLKINGRNVKIIGDSKPFENYNYRESQVSLPIISKLTDTYLIKGKYYEEKVKEIEINENMAENIMKISVYDNLIKMLGSDSKVLNTSFNLQEDENYYYLSAQVEVVEDIGEKVRIYPTEENQGEESKED